MYGAERVYGVVSYTTINIFFIRPGPSLITHCTSAPASPELIRERVSSTSSVSSDLTICPVGGSYRPVANGLVRLSV